MSSPTVPLKLIFVHGMRQVSLLSPISISSWPNLLTDSSVSCCRAAPCLSYIKCPNAHGAISGLPLSSPPVCLLLQNATLPKLLQALEKFSISGRTNPSTLYSFLQRRVLHCFLLDLALGIRNFYSVLNSIYLKFSFSVCCWHIEIQFTFTEYYQQLCWTHC